MRPGVRTTCLLVLGAVAMASGAATAAGPTAAPPPDDQGVKQSELAEAELRVHLLTNTGLRPTDITCALPPTHDVEGDLLCFALLNDRTTISALATLDGERYEFTAVSKAGRGAGATDSTGTSTEDPSTGALTEAEANAAVLAQLEDAVTAGRAELETVLLEHNDLITSIDNISYDPSIETFRVDLTSSATTDAQRDDLAWSVTDTAAYLWERPELRDPAATLRPRFQVTIDGEIYGTAYDLMIQVADYEVTAEDWLATTTLAAPFATSVVTRSQFV